MNAKIDSDTDISDARRQINTQYLVDEAKCVEKLLKQAKFKSIDQQRIQNRAEILVNQTRSCQKSQSSIEAFIHEYSLSSEEGVILMCLAEALLRIPDPATADKLIRDKLMSAEFSEHIGKSASLLVNASTWGLVLTGKLISFQKQANVADLFSQLVIRLGEPMLRNGLMKAMKLMASQYVMGSQIENAIKRSKNDFHSNYQYSFDMLGESAISTKDANQYFVAYQKAIIAIAQHSTENTNSISIKLSALHPRYEVAQLERVHTELLPKVILLVELGMQYAVAVTLDAEESSRLELSLDIFHAILANNKNNEGFKTWSGFGLAVQAYQKRAPAVLVWLKTLAEKYNLIIPVRLVKGAYWDTEIKLAQEAGLVSYPVFTRKCHTDISYQVCAKFLLANNDHFYPQFATHNAYSIAVIQHLSNSNNRFEFQRLHGMGENLYRHIIDETPCRVYSPVGDYQDLLPYLVRRLLENGANTSFVNRIEDESVSVFDIVKDPVEVTGCRLEYRNLKIPLPADIYQKGRCNSRGMNLNNFDSLKKIDKELKKFSSHRWDYSSEQSTLIVNPANRHHVVGYVDFLTQQEVEQSLSTVIQAAKSWRDNAIEIRVQCIENLIVNLQKNKFEIYALSVFEAGKLIPDAVSELREAIDFCEYYVQQARMVLTQPLILPGPVGEENKLTLEGRGVFVCISPWNFPLAIFIGQIVAALISGNVVLAKPSSYTPLIAHRIVDLLYQSGVPQAVMRLLNCKSSLLSHVVLNDKRISGVAFTGSFDTALSINQLIASRKAAIIPFIAETGGQNMMIVDSSALPEQVVKDVIRSSFLSAGQRCSALRVLLIQEEMKPTIIDMVVAAMHELKMGDPINIDTDIPPVISEQAMKHLNQYKKEMFSQCIDELEMQEGLAKTGNYVSPALYEIKSFDELSREIFGPVLHVMSYKADELPDVIQQINDLGYGLTLGIHSRINQTVELISQLAHVGNIYVNRNMIGAVVGVQPFGGEGLSGTGPKAGGPHYLQRFCVEKTVTQNTAAVGGNRDLLTLIDD